MKVRSLEYERRFRKYLFSFSFEDHKKICESIGLRHNKVIE